MWDALMIAPRLAPLDCGDKRFKPNSMMSRIRRYLLANPHRTAYQVAEAVDITQTQAHVALHDMARRGYVCWSLDDSPLRNRQTKHYSIKDEP